MFDILSVYDHICKIRFFHNLRKRQINLKVVRLIEFFLSNRTTTMKTNECILDHLSIQCGISQRSPLLPILFLFYNADLLDIRLSITSGLSANVFIDNTNLLAIGPSTEKNFLNLTKAHKRYLR